MSRILLADDSPHAQRMGERILLEEGYEVVTVTDGDTALIRLDDVAPDVILADVFLPNKSGYDICRAVKNHPRHSHAKVVLLAGSLEPVDEEEVRRVRADGVLRKPFEASVVLETLKALVEAAQNELARMDAVPAPPVEPPAAPEPSRLDRDRVRAAVTLALDAAMPAIIEELTQRVLVALEDWDNSGEPKPEPGGRIPQPQETETSPPLPVMDGNEVGSR